MTMTKDKPQQTKGQKMYKQKVSKDVLNHCRKGIAIRILNSSYEKGDVVTLYDENGNQVKATVINTTSSEGKEWAVLAKGEA